RGSAFSAERAADALEFLAPRARPDLIEHTGELCERLTSFANGLTEVQAGRANEIPAGGRLDEPVDTGHQLALDAGIDLAVERLDRRPASQGAGHVASHPERTHDVGVLGPRLGHHPRDER